MKLAVIFGLLLCSLQGVTAEAADKHIDVSTNFSETANSAFLKPKSLAAQGCMKLGECTEKVLDISSIEVLTDHYGDEWLTAKHKQELIALINRLNAVGAKFYLASDFYFQVGVRGVYYTDNNSLFINEYYGRDTDVFLKVLRHEAWHTSQDCMAGTIDNTMMAIILNPDLIPEKVKMITEIRYKFFAPAAIPWEQEAIYAGTVANMTADALNACATGEMWREYEPTPKTKEWLKQNGYMLITTKAAPD